MEFFRNIINTSTMFTPNTTTGWINTFSVCVANILNPDQNKKMSCMETTTSTGGGRLFFKVEFSSTVINFIVLKNLSTTNLDSLRFGYVNTAGSGSFTLTNWNTSTSFWNNIPSGDLIVYCSISVYEIDIVYTATTTAGSTCGFSIDKIMVGNKYCSLENNPSVKNFNIFLEPMQYNNLDVDGKLVKYKIQDNFKSSIKLNYISTTERQNLKDLYELDSSFIFIPAATHTSWNGICPEVNWVSDFDFDNFSSNHCENGYSGSIVIEETSR